MMFRRKSKQQHADVKVSGNSGGGTGLFSRNKQSTRKGADLDEGEVVTSSDVSYEAADPTVVKPVKHRSGKNRNNEKHLLDNWFGKHVKEHNDSKQKKAMMKVSDDSSVSSVYSRDEFFAKLDELESKSLSNSQSKRRRASRTLTDADAARLDVCQLIIRREWKRAMTKLQEHPSEARKTKKMSLKGMGVTTALPLHLAVTKKPPSDFVEELIRAYPAGPKQPDKQWKRLPIHIACMCNSGAHVLQVLLNSHKLSLRVLDQAEGRVPLHYVCLYGSPYEISLLMNAEKQALRVKDSKGKTPVDLAKENPNQHRETIVRRLENTLRQMDASTNMSSSSNSRGNKRGSKTSSKHARSSSGNRSSSRTRGPSSDSADPVAPPKPVQRTSPPESISSSAISPEASASLSPSDSTSFPMASSYNDFNASLNFEELRHPAYKETSSHFGSSVPAIASSTSPDSTGMNHTEHSRSITFHSMENAVDINQCEHNRSITFEDEMLARSLQASLNDRHHRSISFEDDVRQPEPVKVESAPKQSPHPQPEPEPVPESAAMTESEHQRPSILKSSSLDRYLVSASQSAAEVESHMQRQLENGSVEASVETERRDNKTKKTRTPPQMEHKSDSDGSMDVKITSDLDSFFEAANASMQSEPPPHYLPSVSASKATDMSQSESARATPKNNDMSRSESIRGMRRSHQLNLMDDDDDMQPRSRRAAPPPNFKKPPPKKVVGKKVVGRGGRKLSKERSKDDLDVRRETSDKPTESRRVKSAPRTTRNSYEYDSPSTLNKNWQEVATGSTDVPALSSSSHHRSRTARLLTDAPQEGEPDATSKPEEVHPLQNSKSLLGSLQGFGSDAGSSHASRDLFKDISEGADATSPFQSVASLMKVVEEQEKALQEKDSEISQLETHLKNLDLRREALAQECEYVRRNAQEKEDIANASRQKVSSLEKQLRELRKTLEVEKEALEVAESSEKVHKETLKEHVDRISATYTEKEVLLTIKENLLHERAEMTRKLINTRNEIKSVEEIQNMSALA